MKTTITLSRWFSILLLTVFTCLIALSLFISIYTGQAMEQQAAKAHKNLLQVYLEKLDSNVTGINRFLSQLAGSNEGISTMVLTEEPIDYFLAKQEVMKQLRNTSFIYNTFNGIFVYSDNRMNQEFLCQLRNGESFRQQEDIRAIIKAGEYTSGWQVVSWEGRVYLLCTVQTGDTCCGAWLEPQSAIQSLTQLQLGESGAILMLDRSGKILSQTRSVPEEETLSGQNNGTIIRLQGRRFLQIGLGSQTLPVDMMALIPESVFAGEVQTKQLVIALVFTAVLILLPVLWYTMNRAVSEPVRNLTRAMDLFGQGRLEDVVAEDSRFTEFRAIASGFNQMTGKVRQLQKDVYQRILSEQKTRLQYLQMQIRPHFFLNALNVIYSFSLTGRNDLIERLTLCLSRYFRYMFQCESSFVPLGAELDHIDTYMEIHRLRDQGEFQYHMEIDEVLREAQIPPLTIQPFVENSVKYGYPKVGGREIYLTAECRQIQGEQKLCITIGDNGPGYPETVLNDWKHERTLDQDVTRKIGLVNVKQRLALTYGADAQVCIGNSPDGGAYSQLILPLHWQEEETTDENTIG